MKIIKDSKYNGSTISEVGKFGELYLNSSLPFYEEGKLENIILSYDDLITYNVNFYYTRIGRILNLSLIDKIDIDVSSTTEESIIITNLPEKFHALIEETSIPISDSGHDGENEPLYIDFNHPYPIIHCLVYSWSVSILQLHPFSVNYIIDVSKW